MADVGLKWFLSGDSKTFGPYSCDEFRQLLVEGRATGDSKVCPQGGREWVALAIALPELFEGAAPPPPPQETARPHRRLGASPGTRRALVGPKKRSVAPLVVTLIVIVVGGGVGGYTYVSGRNPVSAIIDLGSSPEQSLKDFFAALKSKDYNRASTMIAEGVTKGRVDDVPKMLKNMSENPLLEAQGLLNLGLKGLIGSISHPEMMVLGSTPLGDGAVVSIQIQGKRDTNNVFLLRENGRWKIAKAE